MLYRLPYIVLCVGLVAALPATADGRALLDEVTDTLQSQEAMAFDVAMSSVFETDRGKSESALEVSFLLKGEDQAYIVSRSADDEAAIISDGKTRVVHFVSKQQYASDPAPDERTKVVALIGGGPIRVGSSWLAELLHGHPALTDKLMDAQLAGVVELPNADGEQARRIDLTYESYDIALYVEEDEPPLPRRIELDLTRQYQGQTPGASAKLSVVVDVSNWNLSPEAPDEKFAWVKPEGVTEYQPPQRTRLTRGEDDFLGAVAPDFTLPSLKGEEVTLSDHKGEDIVLLDFWATWCGPCRMAMPVVEEVAEKFAEQGVQLYAVNLREAPERIRGFLETVGVEESDVLLDQRGAVQRDYAASNIPRMVVVGKDGTIQAIHRGYSPYLRQQLTQQIETLLKGEMLVEPKRG